MWGERERVVIVAHCILNQATRARWEGGGATRVEGMFSEIVEALARNGVGAIQMECPEFSLYGNPRPPRSKEEYEIQEFKEKCHEIAERAIRALRRMELVAVLGFENSPSCGVERTTRTIKDSMVISPGQGHLMEALQQQMIPIGLKPPFIGVNLKDDGVTESLRKLKGLIDKDK
jgi:predicted secreted protein